MRAPLAALLSAVALLGASAATAPAGDATKPAPRAEPPLTAKDAEARLQALQRLLGRERSTNQELIAALQRAGEVYRNVQPPTLPQGADAGARARRAREMQARAERLDAAVRRLVLRALRLERVPQQATGNAREPVVVAAARVMASWSSRLARAAPARASLSADLRRFLVAQPRLPHARTTSVFDAGFDALARLADPASVPWLLEHHTQPSTDDLHQWRVKLALQAVQRFPELPSGRVRHRGFKLLLERYRTVAERYDRDFRWPGEERGRGAATSIGRAWQATGAHVIAALRYLALAPKDDRGRPYRSLPDLDAWFRAHADPRAAPWTDA